MKTIKLFIIGLLFIATVNAQEKDPIVKSKKHDFSIGFMNSMRFKLSYDYLLNNNTSIGTSISYSPKNNFFDKGLSPNKEFSINFNSKHYLSKKKNQGMYFSPTLSYINGTSYKYDYRTGFTDNERYTYRNIHLGINVGYKYVTKNNLFFDASAGLSERIFNFNHQHTYYYYNRYKTNFSISIGKRF